MTSNHGSDGFINGGMDQFFSCMMIIVLALIVNDLNRK